MEHARRRSLGRAAVLAAAVTLIASSATYAAVSTDQPDYAPGSTVTISGDNSDGAGYVPGNAVDVAVSGPNGWAASCTATVSDAGVWSCQVILSNDPSVAVGGYTYTATQKEADGASVSEESGTFTDAANTETSVTSSGSPSIAGQLVTFTATVKTPTSSGTTVTVGQVTFGTGANCSGGFSQLQDWQNVNASGQVTFAIALTTTTTIRACYSGYPVGTPSTYQAGFGTFTQVVNPAPANTAPIVTFDDGSPTTANEGDTKTFDFTIKDPDADAWTFASDYPSCGLRGSLVNGSDSITAKAGTFQCTFPDGPATSTVAVKVFDGTANSGEATNVVTINNVDPTIAIDGNANVDEGSTYTLTLGAVTDPGTDTVTDYVVHWGDGDTSDYSTHGAKTHVYADGPNDYDITVDLTDEDGTFSDAANAFSVHVRNVAPTVNSVTVTNGSAVACLAGNTASLSFSFGDPGANDGPWGYDINWGDGSPHTTGSVGPQGDAGPFSHGYAAGTYTPSVTVTDKDGDSGSKSAPSGAVSFMYDATGVLQPVNDTQAHQDPSIFKYGSTIPVKIQVTDCDGIPVSGLSPTIAVKKVSGSTPGGTDETTTSTSGADTGTTMRWSDPLYIYNLATKSLTDSSATYQITITGPFADVIARFGTKAK